MGYCYISGVMGERRKWRFDKCDGRQSIEDARCGGGDPGINYTPPKNGNEHARCHHCIQYCKTYKQAIDALNDWYKNNPEEKRNDD